MVTHPLDLGLHLTICPAYLPVLTQILIKNKTAVIILVLKILSWSVAVGSIILLPLAFLLGHCMRRF